MRYRLRTLIAVAAVTPPILAAIVWLVLPEDKGRPRNAESRKATDDFRQLFRSATELEIIEAGDAYPLRAKSFQGQSLKRLAEAANIIDVNTYPSTVKESIVVNAYIAFRLRKDQEIIAEYFYGYPDSLVDASPGNNSNEYWTKFIMSEKFVRSFLGELTNLP
jgi:hypothetical protein